MDSAIAANVSVANFGQLAATDDVQIVDLSGTLTDDADENGSIIFSGRITGDVNVTFDFDDQAGLTPLILDQARISGSFNFGLTAGGTGGNVAACRALEAIFYDGGANSIVSDSEAAVDLRGAVFEQVALDSEDTEVTGTRGTIDRTDWWQTVPAASMTPSAAITWANAGGVVPFTTTPNQVGVEIANVADGPVSITLKAADGCTVTSTPNPANNDVIVRAFLTEV
jgi:hypothetical protein